MLPKVPPDAPQEAPNTPPIDPKRPPRGVMRPPRGPQDTHKRPLKSPKRSHETPTTPMRPPRDPKMRPRDPKRLHLTPIFGDLGGLGGSKIRSFAGQRYGTSKSQNFEGRKCDLLGLCKGFEHVGTGANSRDPSQAMSFFYLSLNSFD